MYKALRCPPCRAFLHGEAVYQARNGVLVSPHDLSRQGHLKIAQRFIAASVSRPSGCSKRSPIPSPSSFVVGNIGENVYVTSCEHKRRWANLPANGISTMAISLLDRIGMWWRQVPSSKVAHAMSIIEAAGATVSVLEIERHYLAGGDIVVCAEAMSIVLDVSTQADWREIGAADLVGIDVLTLARDTVRQRVPLSEILSERLRERFSNSVADPTSIRLQ